ncbi:hypothetical protein [Halalkalirubrum salinum]|uniref:hypothetical protein n=1 Tax=Halalkalirubrum salinum TaxID=2563889 RepID=UPI0010FB21DC|nr:hypothetical protein [Halalkalirubrum salinum]
MSTPASVLVYDGRKDAFRTVVDLLTRDMGDLVAAPWESARIQRFLEAQFGDRPFVFLLVEENSVHAGETAVRRALDARGLDPTIARTFERLYPKIADPFGRVVHGEAPADIHGTFELTPAAREHIDPIRRRQ